ncbi:very short patch repair endonuclease [Microbacterium natoriense]|uniref:very short patch repair endonuclease n=1 Tax=Microbacterium natoriense TaxID=284570 RepID=UPI0027D8A09E|nr:very short patch repair endonuclease [Microbacterium natoriense]
MHGGVEPSASATGLVAPTPGRRRNMQANRRRDTKPERAIRSLLHAEGFRYRCDLRIDLAAGRVRPDIVFTRRRIAVFVDGCFWHCCPVHGAPPRVNTSYWAPKLQRNVERDARNTRMLETEGWTVIRIWEHEDPQVAAFRIGAAVSRCEAGRAGNASS